MGAAFQSVDVVMNVAWVSLSLTTLLAWRASGRPCQHRRAILAVVFVLVLLFPVISTADDIAEQALTCDLALSKQGTDNPHKGKPASTLEAQVLPAVCMPASPLVQVVGERPPSHPSIGHFAFPGSTSASHAPPQL